MNNTLFGIAAVIISLSCLVVAISLTGLIGEYRDSIRRQAAITEKSAHIVDSIATTLFLKLAERDKEIAPEESAAIMKELTERSKHGYLFERLILNWKFDANKKSDTKNDAAPAEKDSSATDADKVEEPKSETEKKADVF